MLITGFLLPYPAAKPEAVQATKVQMPEVVNKEEVPQPQPTVEQPKVKEIAPKKTYPAGVCVAEMKEHFPESDWGIAYAIMRAESGARPDAIGGPNKNGTYDYGCFQINNEPSAQDPHINAVRAYQKRSSKTGWNHWTVWRTGAYKKYL